MSGVENFVILDELESWTSASSLVSSENSGDGNSSESSSDISSEENVNEKPWFGSTWANEKKLLATCFKQLTIIEAAEEAEEQTPMLEEMMSTADSVEKLCTKAKNSKEMHAASAEKCKLDAVEHNENKVLEKLVNSDDDIGKLQGIKASLAAVQSEMIRLHDSNQATINEHKVKWEKCEQEKNQLLEENRKLKLQVCELHDELLLLREAQKLMLTKSQLIDDIHGQVQELELQMSPTRASTNCSDDIQGQVQKFEPQMSLKQVALMRYDPNFLASVWGVSSSVV